MASSDTRAPAGDFPGVSAPGDQGESGAHGSAAQDVSAETSRRSGSSDARPGPPSSPSSASPSPSPSPSSPDDGSSLRRTIAPYCARPLQPMSSPTPTMPSSVPTRPSHSYFVRPYVSDTSLLVGTTTMKFGATRYGPAAPWACQFGKNDVRTSTGLPISDTWNEIESTSSWMSETCVGVIGVSLVCARSLMSMRFQSFGPDAVHTLSSCGASSHHGAAAHSQGPSSGIGDGSVHCWFQHWLYVPAWTFATTG